MTEPDDTAIDPENLRRDRRAGARCGRHPRGRPNLPQQPGRLPHDRRQRRRALCRQGAQPQEAASPPTPSPPSSPNRLRRMVAETRSMEFVVTHTEVEALLLENNLIKRLRPRYNVLLRDDKSFPYIASDRRPRIPAARQAPRRAQRQGRAISAPSPRPARSTARSIALQRAFLLRSCTDSVFSTPHAALPAVPDQALHARPASGASTRQDYAALVDEARGFLAGQQPARSSSELAAAHAGGVRRAGFRGAPPSSATASARWPRSRRTRTSTCRASATPTSSPPIRPAARPASRSSSSAAARTAATAPISRATTDRCRSTEVLPPSSASSTTTSRRRR